MDRLAAIPIRIERAGAPTAPEVRVSAAALAIISEIERHLSDFLAFGRTGTIDLRWLPLQPADIDHLKEFIGTGEVRATIDALGTSIVQETATPCVWWVSHGGSDGVIGDWLEITEVPSILRSDRAAIPHALQALGERRKCFAGAITDEPDTKGGES